MDFEKLSDRLKGFLQAAQTIAVVEAGGLDGVDLIGGPYIETHETVVKAFRPKSALRK